MKDLDSMDTRELTEYLYHLKEKKVPLNTEELITILYEISYRLYRGVVCAKDI